MEMVENMDLNDDPVDEKVPTTVVPLDLGPGLVVLAAP